MYIALLAVRVPEHAAFNVHLLHRLWHVMVVACTG